MSYTLITGATSGIGYELMKLFARDRNNLVLVARNEDYLKRIKEFYGNKYGIDIVTIARDLAETEAPRDIFDELQERGIEIENLVNNAGVGTYGKFHDTDIEDSLNLIDLNIRSLTYLTRLFLPGMIQKRRGRILNLGSAASFAPGPYMATYYASKAYVMYFSEALHWELKKKGITVTSMNPHSTDTDFPNKAEAPESSITRHNQMHAKYVAERGYEALMQGRRLVVIGGMSKVLAFTPRIMPRAAVVAVSAVLNK
ncbi:MAG TPA: SDR family oxidoreductase [Clostridiaceae bacterium]|nr:SDR family oxidoreductase [Clostridiaceae bacterium]